MFLGSDCRGEEGFLGGIPGGEECSLQYAGAAELAGSHLGTQRGQCREAPFDLGGESCAAGMPQFASEHARRGGRSATA